MKNYTWTVESLSTIDTDTQTNYVVDVQYKVTGTETVNGTTYDADFGNVHSFEITSSDSFIDYANLDEATVIGWVKADLGAQNVTNLELTAGGMIDSKINPPTVPSQEPVPW